MTTTIPPLFHTLLIDPPWNERGGGAVYKRGADRHYALLKTADIPRVIQASPLYRPAVDAHLYLWVTNNFLRDGLWVLDALGFRYVTMLTWAKDRIGLGRYFRGQTEHVLFATRGAYLAPLSRTQSTLITAPRTRHSAKPTALYDLIEQVSPAPRVELFARAQRDGWYAWGDQLPVVTAAPCVSHARSTRQQRARRAAQGSGNNLTTPTLFDVSHGL